MKLKVKNLPKNNKGELLVHVEYAQDDDGQTQKVYTKGHAQGSEFEVGDDLGAAILAKYPGCVKLVTGAEAGPSGGKVPAKDKMSAGAAATA